MRRTLLVMAALALGGCGAEPSVSPSGNDGATYDWKLPPGFPTPAVPAENPMSSEKVALGRYLFYDKRLSGNGTQSCGSCHELGRAFSDGLATPIGSTGDAVPRNSQGLFNVAYFSSYTWANPRLTTLEQQIAVPLFADEPKELDASAHLPSLLTSFEGDAVYGPLFDNAFPDETAAERYSVSGAIRGLASFVRSLIVADAPYDRYAYFGEPDALSPEAKRGMEFFFSEIGECYHCHAGPTFSIAFRSADTSDANAQFFNTGLYNVEAGAGGYPHPNIGLQEFTGLPTDNGKFRPASLRNIELTAPYTHDGSVATLEEVVRIYGLGGRNLESGPAAGDGRTHPAKDAFVRDAAFTEQQISDTVAFLKSLTTPGLETREAFSDPWPTSTRP